MRGDNCQSTGEPENPDTGKRRYHLKCGPLYSVAYWGIGSIWSPDPRRACNFGSAKQAFTYRRTAISRSVRDQFRVVRRERQ